MKRTIIEIANRHNMTGIERVIFYIIAPFAYCGAYTVGYIKCFVESIVKTN